MHRIVKDLGSISGPSPTGSGVRIGSTPKSDEYSTLDEREKIAIATALGETRHPLAMKLFSTLFGVKKTLLGRGRQVEMRRMAVAGLEAMQTVEAFRLLNRELQNQENGRELQRVCREAALRIKQRLERAA
jgi:hypothetical protein